MRYAILDIETTGGNRSGEKITEIAVFIHDGKRVLEEFHSLINPERNIPYQITGLTGITNEMVRNAPKFYEIAKPLYKLLEETVIVAHNAGFDYNFIKREYKELGFEFRRPALCTVKMSRKLFPGLSSYSLGKLTKSLGIHLEKHHRAQADAWATVKLFELLLSQQQEKEKLFLKPELILHPKLSREQLNQLPMTPGVYYFYNENRELIYIGKSISVRKRVFSHLYNSKTLRATEMKAQIAEVRCRETGSELIALLLESHEIKKHKPLYNRAQKRTHHPYSVYTFYDLNGYIRFQPGKNLQGMQELVQLANAEAAKSMLFRAVEEWKLCQKLCGLYKTQGACFHFSLKQCNGACMQKETAEDYNNRAMAFIRKLSFSGESFFIIDEGVTDEECSVIQIENGRYKGFGTLHRGELNESKKALSGCISSYAHNKDTQHILKSYLLQNPQLTIIKY